MLPAVWLAVSGERSSVRDLRGSRNRDSQGRRSRVGGRLTPAVARQLPAPREVSGDLDADREIRIRVPAHAEWQIQVLAPVDLYEQRSPRGGEPVAQTQCDRAVAGVKRLQSGWPIRRAVPVELHADGAVVRELQLRAHREAECGAFQRHVPLAHTIEQEIRADVAMKRGPARKRFIEADSDPREVPFGKCRCPRHVQDYACGDTRTAG